MLQRDWRVLGVVLALCGISCQSEDEGGETSGLPHVVEARLVDDATGEILPGVNLLFMPTRVSQSHFEKLKTEAVTTDKAGTVRVELPAETNSLAVLMGNLKNWSHGRMPADYKYVAPGTPLFVSDDVAVFSGKMLELRLKPASAIRLTIQGSGSESEDLYSAGVSYEANPRRIAVRGDVLRVNRPAELGGVATDKEVWVVFEPAILDGGTAEYHYRVRKRLEPSMLRAGETLAINIDMPAMPSEPTLVGWVVGKSGDRISKPKWEYFAERQIGDVIIAVRLMPWGSTLDLDKDKEIRARLLPGEWDIYAQLGGKDRHVGKVVVPEGGVMDYKLVDEQD